jgi:hypothetical protein
VLIFVYLNFNCWPRSRQMRDGAANLDDREVAGTGPKLAAQMEYGLARMNAGRGDSVISWPSHRNNTIMPQKKQFRHQAPS